MVLTTLEKLTFTLLAIGILVGSALIVIQIQTHHSRNQATLQEVRQIEALTPRDILEKDYEPPELAVNEASKLNVNQASVADLSALPGMSRALANHLIEYRQEKGEIKDLNELSTLKGLTKKKFTALSRLLTLKGGRSGGGDRKLNLNFASLDEIAHLPGVGQTLARAMVDIRNQRGGFHSFEDLREVPGITDAKLKKFIDLIEVK
jgi:competence protein ComEA